MEIENHPCGRRALRLHDSAAFRGDSGYVDPSTGLMVLTAKYLLDRGYCCGAGCRHCPYSVDIQSDAGRPTEAPCWERGRTNPQ